MNSEKYRKLIHQRIVHTIDSWSNQLTVEEQDIYRFFHNLKGTCGTIGLVEVEQFSSLKEGLFSADSSHPFAKQEWWPHVLPLTELIHHDSGEPEAVESSHAVKQAINKKNRNSVLVIDDDVEFVTYLKEYLEGHHYPVSIALNAERGLKLFYEWKPSLILLDIVLPDKSGMDVLKQIVDKARQQHIPIIMISGYYSIQNQILAYRLGAMDFLVKPFDMELLTVIIENRLELKRDWERSVMIDELTGAYNRKYFNQMMEKYISGYNRKKRVFSLAMLDLDHFKHVNDTYGHLQGDEVLKQFVATVQNMLNHEDMVCRYGGEEFALIAPNTTANQMKILLDEIREQFNEILFQAGEQQFQVTFSAGVTEIGSRNNQADKLVDEADQALYSGKNSGRNKTVIYTEDVSEGRSDTRLNVIIVDDDPLIREIVKNRFTEWQPSYEAMVSVHAYSDGSSFLSSDWYRKGEKYIVLLDGYMPELDGLDVLRYVRENYSEQHILVVMLTARNNTSDIVKALQLGADDYVGKPFLMQELVLRLERLASRIFG